MLKLVSSQHTKSPGASFKDSPGAFSASCVDTKLSALELTDKSSVAEGAQHLLQQGRSRDLIHTDSRTPGTLINMLQLPDLQLQQLERQYDSKQQRIIEQFSPQGGHSVEEPAVLAPAPRHLQTTGTAACLAAEKGGMLPAPNRQGHSHAHAWHCNANANALGPQHVDVQHINQHMLERPGPFSSVPEAVQLSAAPTSLQCCQHGSCETPPASKTKECHKSSDQGSHHNRGLMAAGAYVLQPNKSTHTLLKQLDPPVTQPCMSVAGNHVARPAATQRLQHPSHDLEQAYYITTGSTDLQYGGTGITVNDLQAHHNLLLQQHPQQLCSSRHQPYQDCCVPTVQEGVFAQQPRKQHRLPAAMRKSTACMDIDDSAGALDLLSEAAAVAAAAEEMCSGRPRQCSHLHHFESESPAAAMCARRYEAGTGRTHVIQHFPHPPGRAVIDTAAAAAASAATTIPAAAAAAIAAAELNASNSIAKGRWGSSDATLLATGKPASREAAASNSMLCSCAEMQDLKTFRTADGQKFIQLPADITRFNDSCNPQHSQHLSSGLSVAGPAASFHQATAHPKAPGEGADASHMPAAIRAAVAELAAMAAAADGSTRHSSKATAASTAPTALETSFTSRQQQLPVGVSCIAGGRPATVIARDQPAASDKPAHTMIPAAVGGLQRQHKRRGPEAAAPAVFQSTHSNNLGSLHATPQLPTTAFYHTLYGHRADTMDHAEVDSACWNQGAGRASATDVKGLAEGTAGQGAGDAADAAHDLTMFAVAAAAAAAAEQHPEKAMHPAASSCVFADASTSSPQHSQTGRRQRKSAVAAAAFIAAACAGTEDSAILPADGNASAHSRKFEWPQGQQQDGKLPEPLTQHLELLAAAAATDAVALLEVTSMTAHPVAATSKPSTSKAPRIKSTAGSGSSSGSKMGNYDDDTDGTDGVYACSAEDEQRDSEDEERQGHPKRHRTSSERVISNRLAASRSYQRRKEEMIRMEAHHARLQMESQALKHSLQEVELELQVHQEVAAAFAASYSGAGCDGSGAAGHTAMHGMLLERVQTAFKQQQKQRRVHAERVEEAALAAAAAADGLQTDDATSSGSGSM